MIRAKRDQRSLSWGGWVGRLEGAQRRPKAQAKRDLSSLSWGGWVGRLEGAQRLKARRGSNLIEVLIASSMAGVVMLALGGFIASAYRASGKEQDRTFALQKALQIMEEVSAHKADAALDRGVDGFAADGAQFLLTTTREGQPEDALSGNPRVGGYYKYVRRISSTPVPGDEFARQVTVEVFYAEKDRVAKVPVKAKPLAVVSNIIRLNAARVGPRQILDVYALSIENLPHVMRKPDGTQFAPSAPDARRYFEAALRQLESKNPWLGFRVHYVSRLSVGRDAHYRPYVNDGQPLMGGTRDALERVYYYPGRLTDGADSPRYFDPRMMGANVALGGVTGAGGAAAQGGYPACDQYNHAVRLGEEQNAAGEPIVPAGAELSLRQFLEQALSAAPGAMRNAIVVNLHGELFPVVPLRNWSDAAQDPAATDAEARKRRLVTHPYKLAFVPETDTVRLLVHPYMADGSNTPFAPGADHHVSFAGTFPDHARAARIVVKGIKPYLAKLDPLASGAATADDVTIRVVQRERVNNGACETCDEAAYQVKTAWPAAADVEADASRKNHSGPHVRALAGHGGGADPTFDGDDLVVQLRDVDYDAHETKAGTTYYGIKDDPAYRLHGLQYLPDPLLPFLTAASGQTQPRNTARAVIEFKLTDAAARRRFEVLTQLMKADGVFPAAGTRDPATSRTWIHTVAGADWDPVRKLYWQLAGDRPAVPWTEQLQLVGDPRHNPYLDVRQNGLYNPYFSDFTAGEEVYKGVTGDLDEANPYAGLLAVAQPAAFAGTADAWGGVKVDAPAYFRLWREVLLRHDMVFVNASGAPARLLGLGGEFALDGVVGAGDPVHVSKKPYGGSGATDHEADELTGDRRAWIARDGGDEWYAKPWLGELYPPDQAEAWVTTGNLPAGTFRRRSVDELAHWPAGTDKAKAHDHRAVDGTFGLASFLNAVADGAGSPPAVALDGARGRVTDTGVAMAAALHVSLMPSLTADAGVVQDGGDRPPEWSQAPYTPHLAFEWLNKPFSPRAYFDQDGTDGAHASAPLLLKEPASSRRAIVLVNTLRPDAPTQLLATMEAAAVTSVGAYFDGVRQPIGAHNVKPLPRVKIKEPATGQLLDGVTVPIRWFARSVKGSGKPYSSLFAYPMDTAPADGGPLDVVYFVKYRNQTENGPWTLARTAGTVTNAGGAAFGGVAVAEGQPVAHADVKPIPNKPAYPEPVSLSWDTTGLPAGQYLLRVEAYRADGTTIVGTHYAYHEIPVTLVR